MAERISKVRRELRPGRRPIVRRDDDAVRAAYAAHAGELYGFAQRFLGDAVAAEDAVQETFLRAWQSADRFDAAIASMRTWLFSIARNVLTDMARARVIRESRRPPAGPDAEDPIDRVLVACQVEQALHRISKHHRHALVETYYRARPYAEVAAELGIAEGTLRSRVYYGLKALRLALEEMGFLDER